MAIHGPPTFLELIRKKALKDKALVVSSLEKLVMELLPELLQEFFTDRLTNVKVLMETWPPLYFSGCSDVRLQNEIFQAMLYGLYVLLTQKVQLR